MAEKLFELSLFYTLAYQNIRVTGELFALTGPIAEHYTLNTSPRAATFSRQEVNAGNSNEVSVSRRCNGGIYTLSKRVG